MKITLELLKEKGACQEGIDWFKDQRTTDAVKLLDRAIKDGGNDKLNFANWTITRMMTKEQCVRYAIFAAEQVLHLFEKKYPKDERPRKAIEAAKAWLAEPTEKNRKDASAANAAAYAAYADAAADAAYAAANAAYAAANAAAYAAADAADAAAYAWRELKLKILDYGAELLGLQPSDKNAKEERA